MELHDSLFGKRTKYDRENPHDEMKVQDLQQMFKSTSLYMYMF